jgi:hypothetical protein
MATLAFNAESIDTMHYYDLILAALFQVISVMVVIKVLNNYKLKKAEILK